MDKDQVAEVFENIAMLLDLKGENPFKARAYTNAARALSALSEPLAKVLLIKELAEAELFLALSVGRHDDINESERLKVNEVLADKVP